MDQNPAKRPQTSACAPMPGKRWRDHQRADRVRRLPRQHLLCAIRPPTTSKGLERPELPFLRPACALGNQHARGRAWALLRLLARPGRGVSLFGRAEIPENRGPGTGTRMSAARPVTTSRQSCDLHDSRGAAPWTASSPLPRIAHRQENIRRWARNVDVGVSGPASRLRRRTTAR